SDGGTISTEDATMPNASSCMWSTEATDIGVLISSGSFTFTANGLEQILPTTIAAGKKLFVIPVDGVDKTLYALKDYTFAAGTEYTFNVRITTSGEAILEGFTIKGMDAGAQLGNYMIIRNIADLRTFRNRVNDGEYSLCAIQTADIVVLVIHIGPGDDVQGFGAWCDEDLVPEFYRDIRAINRKVGNVGGGIAVYLNL
ncbi:fimbrillin family protein, partial [Bacteroides sp. OttesenSCG-928-E20]|nr:fimbrillin family protein [Bacteroides sp. OttesenSCG-928-E20]